MKALSFIKLAALTAILLSTAVVSTSALATDNDWHILKSHPSPLAKKLYIWFGVTTSSNEFDAQTLINFVKENPEWPKQQIFREKIESHLYDLNRAYDIEQWFDGGMPKTHDGLNYYMDWLLLSGKKEKARQVLHDFWKEAKLDRKETQKLHSRYGNFMPSDSDSRRMNYLLWEQRYSEASYLLPYMSESMQRIANLRIALGKSDNAANKLIKTLTPSEMKDVGVIYDRIKWRRQKDMTDEAIELLTLQPQNPEHAELWWQERNILARRKIEERNFNAAYDIASNNRLKANTQPFAEAEWMAGWLALSFLKQPDRAYAHFENFYLNVNSAISSSRAAYWLGRSDEALKNKQSAKNWYQLAAQFPSTFYGQLASEKIGAKFNATLFMDDKVTPKEQREFDELQLVHVIKLLHETKLDKYSDAFFIKLFLKAKTRADYLLIAKLAEEVKLSKYAVEANKRMQQNLGVFMYNIGYPNLDYMPHQEADRALIHAIVYRESMFDKKAESSAGAKGLMQLMPATAKQLSRQTKNKYSNAQLTASSEYNIKLGYAYLEQLIEKYDGFYPLAIAAYNAGPGNVAKWLNAFGDPLSGKYELIDWLEMIPIYETRNYIQRVMETYYIYQLKFGQSPKTLESFRR